MRSGHSPAGERVGWGGGGGRVGAGQSDLIPCTHYHEEIVAYITAN